LKAAVAVRPGGPEVLELTELPRPKPGRGEALVRLHASSINHVDVWARTGAIPHSGRFPRVLGADGAGTVEEVGDEVDPSVLNTRVLLYPLVTCGSCEPCMEGRENLCDDLKMLGVHLPGTYAEYVKLPAENLVPIPDEMDFTTASTLGVAYLTAWTAVRAADVGVGRSVFIPGATGGFGTAAVRFSLALGATVLASTASPQKAQRLKETGVKHVIDANVRDLAEEVRRVTGGRGVDAALDSVGSATFLQSLRAVRKGGKVVTIGATTGKEVQLDLRFVFANGLNISGVYMGTRKELAEIVKWVTEGRVRPVIDSVYSLEEVAEAHSRVDGRLAFGKVVLRPTGSA